MGIVNNIYYTVIHKLPDHDNVLIKWNVVTQKNWWLLFNRVVQQCRLMIAGMFKYNNNNNDRLTAFDPGQPG